MRLFPIELAPIEDAAVLKDGKAPWRLEESVWIHRPTLNLLADPIELLGRMKLTGVDVGTELFRHAESGIQFARFTSPTSNVFVVVAFVGAKLFPSTAPDVDEFPDEKDTRPVYHLPKWWTYGRCKLEVATSNTELFPSFSGEMVFRTREQRV